MKPRNPLVLGILILFFMAFAVSTQAKEYIVKELPKKMDDYYPPKSKEPKWVQQMHKISGHFGGVFVDIKEKDWENAEKHADGLIKAYQEALDMMPDWKDYFDTDAVKQFAAAVKTRDPAKIGKASRPVGKTCHKCHEHTYVGVWTQYHWPSVENIP